MLDGIEEILDTVNPFKMSYLYVYRAPATRSWNVNEIIARIFARILATAKKKAANECRIDKGSLFRRILIEILWGLIRGEEATKIVTSSSSLPGFKREGVQL